MQVSENEKRTFACWLDLLVPFCGSYTQHNTWTDGEKAEYGYFQDKRRVYAAAELESLRRSSDYFGKTVTERKPCCASPIRPRASSAP